MDDVMKRLAEAAKWEDDFILQYDTEAVWTLIREAVPGEKFLKIKRLFSENIVDTLMHKKLIMMIVRDNE